MGKNEILKAGGEKMMGKIKEIRLQYDLKSLQYAELEKKLPSAPIPSLPPNSKRKASSMEHKPNAKHFRSTKELASVEIHIDPNSNVASVKQEVGIEQLLQNQITKLKDDLVKKDAELKTTQQQLQAVELEKANLIKTSTESQEKTEDTLTKLRKEITDGKNKCDRIRKIAKKYKESDTEKASKIKELEAGGAGAAKESASIEIQTDPTANVASE